MQMTALLALALVVSSISMSGASTALDFAKLMQQEKTKAMADSQADPQG